jgi:hypothetical protein
MLKWTNGTQENFCEHLYFTTARIFLMIQAKPPEFSEREKKNKREKMKR